MLSQEQNEQFQNVLKQVADHGTLRALEVLWDAVKSAAGGLEGEAEGLARQAEEQRAARIAALKAQSEQAQAELAKLEPANSRKRAD